MTKKVFMEFNDNIDKLKQALWFVNMFIEKEYRDLAYLLGAGAEMVKGEYGISCNKFNDDWVWLGEHTSGGYTKDMTQVYYEQKDLGEL